MAVKKPRRVPRWLALALLPAASCPGPTPEDGGTDSGVKDGGTNPCPPGCDQYVNDAGPVFYPDGGPYCLC